MGSLCCIETTQGRLLVQTFQIDKEVMSTHERDFAPWE